MTDEKPAREDRFPRFDTLEQSHTWDELTREVIRSRVEDVPSISFFSAGEACTACVLLECLLALDAPPGVPVLELIDARLHIGDSDGYRYDGMPDDGPAWRRSLAGLDEDAAECFGSNFAGLAAGQRHQIVQAIQDCDGPWHGLPANRVFGLWMRYACTAYYSHPWAWNEIGFGGPAYPRGYKNIGLGRREPWEVVEVDADDPVPWARRVEAARRRHDRFNDLAAERS